MKKCPYCAEMIQDEAILCRYCNTNFVTGTLRYDSLEPQKSKQDTHYYSKGLGCLAILIPGLAQIFNGQGGKGAAMLIGALLLGFVSFGILYVVFMIWSYVDYKKNTKPMAQKEIDKFEEEWNVLVKNEPSFQHAINKLKMYGEGLIADLKQAYMVVNKKDEIAQLADQVLNKYEKAIPFGKIMATDQNGRFIYYDNETVIDTKTYLMWAAKDNEKDINWPEAKNYCENCRIGGYTDWRMPTMKELAGLFSHSECYKTTQAHNNVHLTKLIRLSYGVIWASETQGSKAARFFFGNIMASTNLRALPVRSCDLEK